MKCYLIEDNPAIINFFFKTFKILNEETDKAFEFNWISEKGDVSTAYPNKNIQYIFSATFKQKIKAFAKNDACFFIDLSLNNKENVEVRKYSGSLYFYTAITATEIIKSLLETKYDIKIVIISTIPDANNYWKKTIENQEKNQNLDKLKFIPSGDFDPTDPKIKLIYNVITNS